MRKGECSRRCFTNLLAVLMVALAGCGTLASTAGPFSVGQTVDLNGVPVCKGGGPYPDLVLETTQGDWLLDGVAPATAQSLQGKPVNAHGTVLRLPEAGQARRAELEVSRIYPH